MRDSAAYAGSQPTAAAAVIFAGVLLASCTGDGPEVQATRPLKDAFNGRFLIGVAVGPKEFSEINTMGAELVKRHFNSITAENVLKWENVHPEPDRYDFEPADRFVAFGEKHNMFMVGHTLVWHNQTPEWVFVDEDGKQLTRDRLLKRLRDHIQTVVGRYRGRIHGWDVVNEAVVDDGSYKQSEWLKIIGEDYLLKAFQFAREADPDAELYYNDFSVENVPKRGGVIRLVKTLQRAGVDVAGIGLQGHYLMDWPTVGQLDSTIAECAGLGTQVMITELDLDILPRPEQGEEMDLSRRVVYKEELDPYRGGLTEEKQQELAQRYADLFGVFAKNREKISRVTFWGVHDGTSWLNTFPVAGRTNHPLLFDREGKPKPAFDAVVQTTL